MGLSFYIVYFFSPIPIVLSLRRFIDSASLVSNQQLTKPVLRFYLREKPPDYYTNI